MTAVATGRSAFVVDMGALRIPAALLLAGGLVRSQLPDAPGLPCLLRTMTGIPCPLCGMTTSVTATADLDLAAALQATPAGVALVAVAVAVLVGWRRGSVPLAVPGWVLWTALAAMWTFQLLRFSVVPMIQ